MDEIEIGRAYVIRYYNTRWRVVITGTHEGDADVFTWCDSATGFCGRVLRRHIIAPVDAADTTRARRFLQRALRVTRGTERSMLAIMEKMELKDGKWVAK